MKSILSCVDLIPRRVFRLRPAGRGLLPFGLRLVLLVVFLAGNFLGAAPYPREGMPTEWVQPDGTRLKLRVFGDDFYARTTTEDGYTVIFEPSDLTYYFARLGADGQSLVKTGIPADRALPPGIPKGLTEVPATVQRIRSANLQARVPGQREEWQKRVASARARPAMQKRGGSGISKVGLCIPVQFPDDPATGGSDPVSFPGTQSDVDNFCNQVGYTGFGNSGSVRDYYHDQSNGLLTFTQAVTPMITLPHPRSYYNFADYPANTTLRHVVDAAARMITDATVILKAGGFDFSALSVDEEHEVLATSVMYAGPDSGVWSMGLWPHRSAIGRINVGSEADPIYLNNYQITNAQYPVVSIGTYVHEIGHLLLGYPDLYDYGFESQGVGLHCLMSAGNGLDGGRTPAPIDLYLKSISGWADLTDLAPGAVYEANLPSTGNRGLRIINPAKPAEYFLIENRGDGDKWASHCPDKGILIWHIDESKPGNGEEQMTPSQHYQVSLEQADGAFDLEHGANSGDNFDAFDASDPYFNNGSVPDSRWWSGANSGISVEVRSAPGAVMNVLLGSEGPLPPATDALDLNWTTGGDQAWIGQGTVTHDGADAAASGDIGDSQSSWIGTTVSGPGTLSFWWKVSSQAGSDFLRFEMDGVQASAAPQISGSVDWKQQTVPVPAGVHQLRWTYLKNASVSSGSDTGWLDQVAFYSGLAANVLVSTLADEANGSLDPALGSGTSLREAILHATSGDVIGFVPALGGGTITLGSGLTVGKNYSIDASLAAGGITVSGNDSVRVCDVQSGKTVVMTGLQIVHGRAASNSDGGGIRNAGNLTLNRCLLDANVATDDGGGIYNTGTLVLNSTTLSNNSCADAGGALVNGGTATLGQCTFLNNTSGDEGGAIFNDDSILGLTDCVFQENHANGSNGGGAVNNDNGGAVTLARCTFSANHAVASGGAINSDGDLSFSSCTLSGNSAVFDGGAVQLLSGTLAMTNCTLTANTAAVGAALDGDNTSTLDLVSCTISGNHASNNGGGIEETSGTLRLTNTIVAGNTAVNIGPDLKASGLNLQGGVNLLGSTSGLGGSYGGLTGDPRLAPLGSYGGPTFTMPPYADSPAINHGGATALTADQRGFPRVAGGVVDIGAVELSPAMLVVGNTADSGPGSLRQALAVALPGDTVTFAPDLESGMISLAGTQLTLTRDVMIDASALPGGVAISGGGQSRVLEVQAGVSAFLRGLVITGGEATEFEGGEGGGILNGGDLQVDACIIHLNESDFDGAGIFNHGELLMSRCTISNNESSGYGGGIGNAGLLTLTGCTISRNGCGGGSGAGISSQGASASAVLTLSTIATNFSNGSGGAIYARGDLSLSECTVAGNFSNDTGGIDQEEGSFALYHSVLADNIGADDEPSDLRGTLTAQSAANLVESPGGDTGYTGMVADAQLAPLGLYGGPTATMPPLPGSPAIDASLANGSLDQRGLARLSGAAADLGSVESGVAPPVVMVTTTVDEDDGNLSGTVSLREATRYAAPGSRITFSAALSGAHVLLAGQEIVLGRALTIDGADLAPGVTISGGGFSRIFHVPLARSAALRGVSLSGGYNLEGEGGGILNEGELAVARCSLVGNATALGGGAIHNAATGRLTVEASTFHGNGAGNSGGAIENLGDLYLSDSTVAGNSAFIGGGIRTTRRVEMGNCIVADNLALGPAPDFSGFMTETGMNLLGTDEGVPDFAGLVADPLLGPLGDHGGSTPTLLPQPGSPAIDAGTVSLAAIDQRGLPRVSGAGLDIGAVEIQAGPLLVTNGNDSGPGSLREVVAHAAGGATIGFAAPLGGGTIALTGGQVTLDRDLVLDASALEYVEVAGNGSFRIFEVLAGKTVTMRNLHLRDGAADAGGAIRNSGDLTLEHCRISGSEATMEGGGIFNANELTMTDCILHGNEAGSRGGGLYNEGTALLTRCTFSGNVAELGSGGGICNQGSIEMFSSTIASNHADASGEGVGGGIDNRLSGDVFLRECTVSGNHAGNSGGGIRSSGSGALGLRNTIVGGNSASDGTHDVDGAISTSSGTNLVSTTNGIDGGFSGLVADPYLAPLGDYGGLTEVMPPLPGSPVIDAVAGGSGPAGDQCGRPRPLGPLPDIGAVEAVAFLTLGLADTDGDGIPDLLEPALGLVVGANDSAADGDSDGVSDAAELADMTDPTDSRSYLRIASLQPAAGFDAFANPVFTVQFRTFPGLVYRVEAAQDLQFSGGDLRQVVPAFTASGNSASLGILLRPGRDFVRVVRE